MWNFTVDLFGFWKYRLWSSNLFLVIFVAEWPSSSSSFCLRIPSNIRFLAVLDTIGVGYDIVVWRTSYVVGDTTGGMRSEQLVVWLLIGYIDTTLAKWGKDWQAIFGDQTKLSKLWIYQMKMRIDGLPRQVLTLMMLLSTVWWRFHSIISCHSLRHLFTP